MQITVTGLPGAGKSTLMKQFAEETGVPYVSIGDIQRSMADVKGMTTLELLSASGYDINAAIDLETMLMSNKPKYSNAVFDGRLAWHFIESSFKLFVWARGDIIGARLFEDGERKTENYINNDDAANGGSNRREIEVAKFLEVYDIDISDMSNYHFTIDSSFASIDTILSHLIPMCNGDGLLFDGLLSPRNIIPTQRIRDLNMACISDMKQRNTDPISVSYRDNKWFCLDGHHRLINHIQDKDDFIKVKFEKECAMLTFDELAPSFLYDYEDAFGVNYKGYAY